MFSFVLLTDLSLPFPCVVLRFRLLRQLELTVVFPGIVFRLQIPHQMSLTVFFLSFNGTRATVFESQSAESG